jgi:hypothetical protein
MLTTGQQINKQGTPAPIPPAWSFLGCLNEPTDEAQDFERLWLQKIPSVIVTVTLGIWSFGLTALTAVFWDCLRQKLIAPVDRFSAR